MIATIRWRSAALSGPPISRAIHTLPFTPNALTTKYVQDEAKPNAKDQYMPTATAHVVITKSPFSTRFFLYGYATGDGASVFDCVCCVHGELKSDGFRGYKTTETWGQGLKLVQSRLAHEKFVLETRSQIVSLEQELERLREARREPSAPPRVAPTLDGITKSWYSWWK
jgi:hypothetical protein